MNHTFLKATFVSALLTISANVTAEETGKKVYNDACGVCHNIGVAGAPKLGDAAAWKDRIAAGNDAMYETAIKGKGAMPAKGGRADISDDDIKAAVDFMVANSK